MLDSSLTRLCKGGNFIKYLGLDLSLSSPGFAVIEVRDRQAYLIDVTHTKTNAKEPRGQRYEIIEFAASLFIRKHKPFDCVVREKFASPNPNVSQTVFGAWSAVDRALLRYGYEVSEGIAQSSVKKTITGNGKASKEDVEKSVRNLLRLKDGYKFATDDESDACATVLAYLLKKGLIDDRQE